MRLIKVLFLCLFPSLLQAQVDLHAHLFMNEGLTWIFRGDFFDEHLSATSWKNLLSSQANPKTLNESDVQIMVASLYAAHPILTPWGLKEAIRRQIAQAERFVRENPQWILAKSPQETELALAQGKRALILSLEGASGILKTDQDLKEFFDLGIRIVTLLHLTDDEFGGCALIGGFSGALVNFGPWFNSKKLWSDGKSIRAHSQGLTSEGLDFAKKLIQQKIWIDLSHTSDESLKTLTPLLKEARQPFLYTHNALRKYAGVEREISLSQLQDVKETGGLVGVLPSPRFLRGTPLPPHTPEGGIEAFVKHYNEIADIIGPEATMIGSDFNGAIPHLKPSKDTGTSLDEKGLWHVGQSKELLMAMQKKGAKLPPPGHHIATFLKAWKRVVMDLQ